MALYVIKTDSYTCVFGDAVLEEIDRKMKEMIQDEEYMNGLIGKVINEIQSKHAKVSEGESQEGKERTLGEEI